MNHHHDLRDFLVQHCFHLSLGMISGQHQDEKRSQEVSIHIKQRQLHICISNQNVPLWVTQNIQQNDRIARIRIRELSYAQLLHIRLQRIVTRLPEDVWEVLDHLLRSRLDSLHRLHTDAVLVPCLAISGTKRGNRVRDCGRDGVAAIYT